MTYLMLTICLVVALFAGCSSQPAGNANPHAGMNHNSSANIAADSTAANVDHSTMNHGSMDNGSMDNGSMASSPDAKAAPYDLQFIDTMIAHHEGAIVMVAPAFKNAKTLEITRLAEEIQRDQQKDIAQMKGWRIKWFPGAKPAVNMEMAGMAGSMIGMDMKKLEGLKDVEFDLEFIRQMIPHHEGAIVMANDAIKNAKNQELKTLAKAIIKAQQAEIAQMRTWQKAWTK